MVTNVSACLVTRGNVDMQPILDELPFTDIYIWDNSEKVTGDIKTFGRYAAMTYVGNDWVYFQDDDVIVTREDIYELYNEFMKHLYQVVANYAHGSNRAGYDIPLVGAGAFTYKSLMWHNIGRYLSVMPKDDDFLNYCDFAIMRHTLHFKEMVLPYTRLYEDDDTRLCRQPWAEEAKRRIYNAAGDLL